MDIRSSHHQFRDLAALRGGAVIVAFRRSRRIISTAVLLFVTCIGTIPGETPAATDPFVVLRHNVDSTTPYRIVSINDQTISLNGALARYAQIVTRVRMRPDGHFSEIVGSDRYGAFDAEFFLTQSDRQVGSAVGLQNRYRSRFLRSERGEMKMDEGYVLPVARDVPRFPERAVAPGDEWTAPAYEVHDLRADYAVPDLLSFSFDVQYRYDGITDRRGRQYHAIDVGYDIVHRESRRNVTYPIIVSGRSDQTLYWDNERGRLAGSEETYWIQFVLSNGRTILYEGTATTEVFDAAPLPRQDTIERIEDGVVSLALDDVRVVEDSDGVTIVLERIGFPPDSARLTPQEIQRLRSIASILKEYPNNDILVTGHTALAGTQRGRDMLSLQRAEAVGRFLIEMEARRPDRVLFRGMGAREPRGDNSTETGRQLNRRVEITILDN